MIYRQLTNNTAHRQKCWKLMYQFNTGLAALNNHCGTTHGSNYLLEQQKRHIFAGKQETFSKWDKNQQNNAKNLLRFLKYGNSSNDFKWKSSIVASILIGGALFFKYIANEKSRHVHAKQQSDMVALPMHHKTPRSDLPTYKMDEISKHNNSMARIWISYGIGVYDITEFVPEHPGSDKIMLGAGGAIDPFWHVFQQHNTPEILALLESFRIGNLTPEDDVGTKDLHDPWSSEPKRSSILRPASLKPFNAEPPPFVLAESYYTPVELFYVRNHLPVPDVDPQAYELEIEIEGNDSPLVLTLDQIKSLPKHNVTAAIMCGGNRRSEMNEVKAVKGLSWGPAAVGNAVWSGPKLCDILKELNIHSDEIRHVHFEGLDTDPTSNSYAASIPLSKAMDPRGDVILAYEMNGQPLTRDHGFPCRVIVPGVVGARNVKWLGRIIVSKIESNSHWQQNDYKGFSPSTDWDTVDFSKSPAIQNMPVTSAICSPQAGDSIKVNENGLIIVKGYAWSGGGNQIVRVDVTTDHGKTWHVADLETCDKDAILHPTGRNWGWTLWTAKVPIAKADSVEIWSKAVDSNYNCQPETFEFTWNLRGVLSNAYHRIRIKSY